MPETLGYGILIVVLVIFMGWFFLGTQWNVRKGDVLLKWLRQGMPLIGERTTMRWLGSSVLELKIAKAKEPFRTMETLVVFEPRDVVFLWAFARLRGRRDTLIFRSQLRSTPPFELEAFDLKAWTSHTSERKLQSKAWSRLALTAPQSLVAYYSGDSAAASAVIELACHSGAKLVRLSVRRSVPNLEVQWLLPDVRSFSARDLFVRLRQLGQDSMQS